jgi:hypothetical protein
VVKVVASVVRFPAERGRLPVALSILLQVVALLALVTVVRDRRPDPRIDPIGWANMGVFVEFTSIAPLAILFMVVAMAGLHALDPAMSAADRAIECKVITGLFGVGVTLVDIELIYYGLWKGIWEMFGAMAAIAFVDLALVFLVFRYMDSVELNDGPRRAAPTRRSR